VYRRICHNSGVYPKPWILKTLSLVRSYNHLLHWPCDMLSPWNRTYCRRTSTVLIFILGSDFCYWICSCCCCYVIEFPSSYFPTFFFFYLVEWTYYWRYKMHTLCFLIRAWCIPLHKTELLQKLIGSLSILRQHWKATHNIGQLKCTFTRHLSKFQYLFLLLFQLVI